MSELLLLGTVLYCTPQYDCSFKVSEIGVNIYHGCKIQQVWQNQIKEFLRPLARYLEFSVNMTWGEIFGAQC